MMTGGRDEALFLVVQFVVLQEGPLTGEPRDVSSNRRAYLDAGGLRSAAEERAY